MKAAACPIKVSMDTGILTYNILNSPVLQLKHFSNLLCGLSCPGLRRPPLLEEHHPVTSSPLDATSTQSNCYSPAQPLMYVFNWFLLHDLSVTRWVNPIMSGGKSVCFCFLVGLWPRSFVFRCWFSWRNANLAGGFAVRLAFGFFGVAVCVVGG